MENEQAFGELIQLLAQIVTATSPEWAMQFLQAGLEEAANAGGEEMPAEQGGPPPMPGGPQIGGMRAPPPPAFKR